MPPHPLCTPLYCTGEYCCGDCSADYCQGGVKCTNVYKNIARIANAVTITLYSKVTM